MKALSFITVAFEIISAHAQNFYLIRCNREPLREKKGSLA